MKIALLPLLLILPFNAFGRKKYCDVVLNKAGLFSSSVTIEIHTGEDRRLYQYLLGQDSSLATRKYSEPVDVINHMSRLGWDLVSVEKTVKNFVEIHMYFSREFEGDKY